MIEELSNSEMDSVSGGVLQRVATIYGYGGHYDVYSDTSTTGHEYTVYIWHADS
jgi:bacteriocin-like protein